MKKRHSGIAGFLFWLFSTVIDNEGVFVPAGGAYQIRTDSQGRLGFFLNGTEVLYLDKIALPNVRIGTPQPGTWYMDSVGAITWSSGFADAWSLSIAGDVEHRNPTIPTGQWISLVNNIATKGFGVPAIYGLDNRAVAVADGSPIVLYAVPAGPSQLFDAALEIDAFAFTSGTATYTMTYTENGVAQTIVVTATAINVVSGVRRLIVPDASTNVTVQLTGPFVATCRLSAALMQLAR